MPVAIFATAYFRFENCSFATLRSAPGSNQDHHLGGCINIIGIERYHQMPTKDDEQTKTTPIRYDVTA